MNANDLIDIVVLGAASGRVSYSITKDEIFRPLREYVYARSAPHSDDMLVRDDSGDNYYPARMMHRGHESLSLRGGFIPDDEEIPAYFPSAPLREPGFFGQLIECPYCLSFYVSAFAFINWLLFGDIAVQIAALFALWAISTSWAAKLL